MGHYKSNVRDLEFNLFEIFDLGALFDSGAFGDLDEGIVRTMLGEAARLAEGPVAEPYAETDRNPPVFTLATHSVRLPEPFKAAVRAWQDGEWWRVGKSEVVGVYTHHPWWDGPSTNWCSAHNRRLTCT